VRPVERRVAATDDHDALPGERRRIGDAVEDSASVPRRGRGLRKAARFERADSGRDDDRPRGKPVRLCDQREDAAGLLQRDDALVAVHRRAELRGLLRQRADEVLGEYLCEPAHVEDVLFRIQRGELSTGLRKRIDNLGRSAAHAGVKLGEEPGGPRTNYRDVPDLARHGRKFTAVRGRINLLEGLKNGDA
jgi:hypothetical protein